jgi:hypothetical protein
MPFGPCILHETKGHFFMEGDMDVTIYRRDGESKRFIEAFGDYREEPKRFLGYESGLRYMCFRMTQEELNLLHTMNMAIIDIE